MNRNIDEYIAKRNILTQSCNNIRSLKHTKQNSISIKHPEKEKALAFEKRNSAEKPKNSSDFKKKPELIENSCRKKNFTIVSSAKKKEDFSEIVKKFDLKCFLVKLQKFTGKII